jgi:NAD+ kinase
VAGRDSRLEIELEPGHGGARIELDGQIMARVEPHAPRTLEIGLRPDYATLVALGGEESLLAGLRRRRVIIDSPRMLARDDREAAGRRTA